MEHKLVELARAHSTDPGTAPFLKRQIHRDGIGQDRSGMICSGEQTVAFMPLTPASAVTCREVISAMASDAGADLVISEKGIRVERPGVVPVREHAGWLFREPLSALDRMVIVGGGHVSLALSRTMKQLGFHVRVIDDRHGLNTMETNSWADTIDVIPYVRIGEHLPEDPRLFIALVSHGYRTDGLVLRQLLGRRYAYIGMLGSAEKVKRMFDDMKEEGYSSEELGRVHAPIGMPIHSRTPEEIAVSIAAEIIRVKNG